MSTEIRPLVRRELRAMNSEIELASAASDAEHRLDRAEAWLAAFEARYSRFRILSELSRLNASSGRPFRASKGLIELVSLALAHAERSSGLFDPTVLAQLLAAGYDRSFELVGPGRVQPVARASRFSWRDVGLDASTRCITLPEGAGIDLGGIGKGWAVDRLAGILGVPSMANGGGDIYASGRPPEDDTWRIGVADPYHPDDDLLVLSVVDRGVATSSSLKRRWQSQGLLLHHLIDPRTGRPSESDAVQVTVVAPSAVMADFHAKVALLQGVVGGLAYLEREAEVEGLIVGHDGVAHPTSLLGQYL